jgi:UDP:flavonoid glycosyltransferase YjiC (YdhE family)
MLSGKKILCAAAPIYGHAVPVLTLGLDLQKAGNDVQMVSYNATTQDLYGRYHMKTTPATTRPNDPVRNLLQVRKILETHQPDVTICDWSKNLWLALQAWRPACRVSILRCELMFGYQRRNPFLPDKFPFETVGLLAWLNDCLSQVGLERIADWRDLCRAEVIVVPSIPEIDPLPDGVRDHYPESTFVYTGPLLLQVGRPTSASLRGWIASSQRKGTQVVLVTLGTTTWGANIYTALADCLERTEFAVIMVIPDDQERARLEQRNGPRFQAVGLTDLRDLAERVDLVVHHCGHGTLHTVLLAGKPSLTIPSGQYDREDNALRLEDLACGRHLGRDFFDNGLDSHALAAAAEDVLTDSTIKKGVSAMSRTVGEYVQNRGPAELGRVLAANSGLR